jgi:hypothetical protein
MKQTNTITLYATVSNNASSCVCKNGRNYSCFEIWSSPNPVSEPSSTTSSPSASRAIEQKTWLNGSATKSLYRHTPSRINNATIISSWDMLQSAIGVLGNKEQFTRAKNLFPLVASVYTPLLTAAIATYIPKR